MKPRVLITAPYMLRERSKVEKLLQPHALDVTWAEVKERLEEPELLKCIAEFEGIICGDDRITPKVLDQAKKLKTIVKWGTGIDSIDKIAAEARGISVFRTPGAFTEPVADTTLALILAFSRRLIDNDAILKNDGWDKPQCFGLFERTIGIIGYGDIGKAVAKRLKGFGSTVLVNDVCSLDSSMLAKEGVVSATKEEIFKKADFITLHSDLNASSRYLLNENSFNQMLKKPVIINTARGPLVEENALVHALQNKKISGAGLDVFEEEPLPLTSPLRRYTNVLLSSHNSNSSPASWDRVHKRSVEMLVEGLKKDK